MTLAEPFDLERDRDLGQLLDHAFAFYRRHLGTILVLSAGVVVSIDLAIFGLGLGHLTAGYDADPPTGEGLLSAAVSLLLITPLITAMIVHVLLAAQRGQAPSARAAAQAGLDAFAPLLAALLLSVAGIALGFVALIVPGIVLAVHWQVVPQAVVVDGARWSAALRRSWSLVRGNAWWVFGVVVVTNLLAAVASAIVSLPAAALADAVDAQAVTLAGTMLAQTFALSFIAVALTLLYFTLRARARLPRERPVP